jgi:pSer/pThr/pTyr-binding forkhead associated (FHA) protein
MQVVLRIAGGKLEGTRLFFPPGQYLFGRAQGCHVLFAPSSIASRRHCLLRVTKAGLSVRDLSSRNGTFVNKKRIVGEVPLAHSNLLGVAETTFHVEINLSDNTDSELGVEVSGKPLGETIDIPLDHTAFETKLSS